MATLLPPTEVSFTLPHIRLTALRWGEADAPLVVCLHGWLDNGNSFALLAPYLVRQGYQVLALEFPGHGHSDNRNPGNFYHFLDYLYELKLLWPMLNQPPALLLGHSMGGILAKAFAALYPDWVDKLVVVEALGPLTATEKDTATNLRRGFESRDKPSSTGSYASLDALYQARAAAGGFALPLAKLLMDRNLCQGDDGRWSWRSDPRLRVRSAWMMTEAQAASLMSELTSSMLVVLGEQGFEELKARWPERQNWFKQARMQTIPGGHHCHMEHPEALSRFILAELA